jgi:hypothetical protein
MKGPKNKITFFLGIGIILLIIPLVLSAFSIEHRTYNIDDYESEGYDDYSMITIIPLDDLEKGKLHISFFDGGWSSRIYVFEIELIDERSNIIWNYTSLPPSALTNGPYAYHRIIDITDPGDYSLNLICDDFSILDLELKYFNNKGIASTCGIFCGVPLVLSFGIILMAISWQGVRKKVRKNLEID